MKILDINLANKDTALAQVSEALAQTEFAGKEVRLYITKHNKTFRGQPTKTGYASPTVPATNIEAAAQKAIKAPAKKKSHHKPGQY